MVIVDVSRIFRASALVILIFILRVRGCFVVRVTLIVTIIVRCMMYAILVMIFRIQLAVLALILIS